jgi:hypothetical protein
MQDPKSIMAHNEEAIQHAKRDGWNDFLACFVVVISFTTSR